MKVLIVGAGKIAQQYIKICQSLNHDVVVIGRSDAGIKDLISAFPDVHAYAGGLERNADQCQDCTHAIVATPITVLEENVDFLMDQTVPNILAEKPLTYSLENCGVLLDKANASDTSVFIAFNRRAYTSVQKAKEVIDADGGISSIHYDFTEAIFRIDPTKYDAVTNQKWGVANSAHVIETAFYLAGVPLELHSRQDGKAVEWHPSGSIFTGSGITTNDVPFTYHANWGCPGRWNIEVMTTERKLLLSPMEKLHQQKKGTFQVELVDIDYASDETYKPGFYQQTKWFLDENVGQLLSLADWPNELSWMNKIMGYQSK